MFWTFQYDIFDFLAYSGKALKLVKSKKFAKWSVSGNGFEATLCSETNVQNYCAIFLSDLVETCF